MANVMNERNLKNRVSRNGFDLSGRVAFTAKVGELLPVRNIECMPGDVHNINISAFTRTQPVQTAAFTRIREYYDVFFVPSRLLWRGFPTFVTQMQNNTPYSQTAYVMASPYYQPTYLTTELNSFLSSISTSSLDSANNCVGYNRAFGIAKLMDLLGCGQYYKTIGVSDTAGTPPTGLELNLLPILAYQKIYQDFYRDSQWENSSPWTCNVDYMSGKTHSKGTSIYQFPSTSGSSDGFEIFDTPFDLRYCNWNKDYFMGLLPSPQYGSSSVVDIDSTDNNFSILQLRQAESKQKWSEIALSGKQDYASQIEKHFDTRVSNILSSMCSYIGGTSNSLDINEVVNTSLSGSSDSASIKGKGVGSVDGNIHFECKEHGYLMVVYHAIPLLDYELDGVDRQNLKVNATDYAIPEFDKIGMQTTSTVELLVNHIGSIVTPELSSLGYAPRYAEYKTYYDKVTTGFRCTDLSTWCAPINHLFIYKYLQSSASVKRSYTWKFLKVHPNVLDSMFGVNADESINTDNLLINCNVGVRSVRNLDYDGLPY